MNCTAADCSDIGHGPSVFLEALLRVGSDSRVSEAESAVERLGAHPVLKESAVRDVILLKSRALLARAHGDEVAYRDLTGRYLDMATSVGFEGHIAMAEAMVGAK